MKTSGITAPLPAQDLGRAKAFYIEKVGLQAIELCRVMSERIRACRSNRPDRAIGPEHVSDVR